MADSSLSKSPFLKKMPSHWHMVEFGEVLDGGTRNGVYKSKEFHGRGTKIVNMGELFANPRLKSVEMRRVELTELETSRSGLESGDLLFARRSLVAEGAGKCSIVMEVREPTTFESSIIRARPDGEQADSLFLYYLFSSPFGKYSLQSILRHVAVAGITGTDLVELSIPLPPLAEQRTISHILGSLDDKIELNCRMNATLEEMSRAIFKSWFVDFDPVRAKSEGRKPYGMPDDVAALFPDSFEDSVIGEIPKGWEVKPLDDIANFLNGAALQKYPPESDESLPVIKIAELRRGVTESSGRASVNLPRKFVVEDGDLLFSWSGSLEVQFWTGGRGALNQHLFKVTSNEYPDWFYYFWILQHLPDFRGIAADKATTMGHIKRHHLSDALTAVPPPKQLEAVGEILHPMLEQTIANDLESRTLTSIRDTLLPKLMSGEIRVSEAEQQVEEVL